MSDKDKVVTESDHPKIETAVKEACIARGWQLIDTKNWKITGDKAGGVCIRFRQQGEMNGHVSVWVPARNPFSFHFSDLGRNNPMHEAEHNLLAFEIVRRMKKAGIDEGQSAAGL